MNKLSVNIDHVATVRQARQADEPDPVWAAVEAELGGADGITFHLREDRRHINDRDAELLRRTVAMPLNMEMSIAADIVDLALKLRPAKATLVPERREELTTEGGLDVAKLRKKLTPVVERLSDAGIETSAFIVPAPAQIEAAAECGFHTVEFWTGGFAHARPRDRPAEVLRLVAGVALCNDLKMDVRAGHGLTYRNIAELASSCAFSEYNIGHSIVARAVLVGMRVAVQEMKRLLQDAKGDVLIRAMAPLSLDDEVDDDEDWDDEGLDAIDGVVTSADEPVKKSAKKGESKKNGHH
jgi:pyridoxine 5-phosphate synthase